MADAASSPDAGAAYKDRVREMWRRRGPGYDVNNALHPPLCRKLVQLAAVPPGATVLDVCCAAPAQLHMTLRHKPGRMAESWASTCQR
jgi:ubiquinone/menaquinone biosynthesis C-methylase UbiE